jgi:hypothetical protein
VDLAWSGQKRQKIGLKEQAPALIPLQIDGASLRSRGGSYPQSGTQDARLPQASRAPLPPIPVPSGGAWIKFLRRKLKSDVHAGLAM